MKYYYKILSPWGYAIVFLAFNYWSYITLYSGVGLNREDKFLTLYIGSVLINLALSLGFFKPLLSKALKK